MKTPFAIAVGLFLSCQMAAAWPQVYQWKDSSGRTIVSDTPPPGSIKGSRNIESAPPAEAGQAAKLAAEREKEFRKRQQASREKADKEAKDLAAAAESRGDCERARRQLAALESGERMVTRDESGGRRYLEDAERQQEMERSRRIMADTCSK